MSSIGLFLHSPKQETRPVIVYMHSHERSAEGDKPHGTIVNTPTRLGCEPSCSTSFNASLQMLVAADAYKKLLTVQQRILLLFKITTV